MLTITVKGITQLIGSEAKASTGRSPDACGLRGQAFNPEGNQSSMGMISPLILVVECTQTFCKRFFERTDL